MGRRPVMPDGADDAREAAEMPPEDGGRQGELWDASGGKPFVDEGTEAGSGESVSGNIDAEPGGEAETGPARTPDTAAAGEAEALDEVLRVVRYVSSLVEEGMKREPGPSKAEWEKLVRSLERLGGTDPDYVGAVRAAAELSEGLGTHRADFDRWAKAERRWGRRLAALAMAVCLPAFLLLGVLVEQQFQVIPLHDPTGGWSGHIWDNYGRAVVDCVSEAMRTDAEVNCPLVVRRP